MALKAAIVYAFVAALSTALTALLLRWRLSIVDVPNPRSSHDQPKPRTGGIALFLSILAGYALWAAWIGFPFLDASKNAWIVAGAVYFFVLGLLDDVLRLPEWLRLSAQLAFAFALAVFGWRLQTLDLPGFPWALPPAAGVIVAALWYAWFINLFNFMDGIDGIASSEALLVGLLIYTVTGSPWSLILSAAALGFLVFNRQPSRIFMGDGGSYLLGYLIAVISVQGSADVGIPFIVFILFSGTFIADTTATLLRRMLRGEQWYKAHRSHYYQRLTDLGFSHAQVTWMNVGLTAALGIAGLGYVRCVAVFQWMILAVCSIVFGMVFFCISKAEAGLSHRRILEK